MRIHFGSLTITILNFLFKKFTTYSFERNLELGIELLTLLSGVILFFLYFRPLKKINIYFSIYAITSVILLLSLIFRGMFWSLVISTILIPIIPDNKEFDENGIIISIPFQGFMAPCCFYQVKERQLLIFEKDYGIFYFNEEGPIDFKTLIVNQSDTEIVLTYATYFEEGVVKNRIIKRY